MTCAFVVAGGLADPAHLPTSSAATSRAIAGTASRTPTPGWPSPGAPGLGCPAHAGPAGSAAGPPHRSTAALGPALPPDFLARPPTHMLGPSVRSTERTVVDVARRVVNPVNDRGHRTRLSRSPGAPRHG